MRYDIINVLLVNENMRQRRLCNINIKQVVMAESKNKIFDTFFLQTALSRFN